MTAEIVIINRQGIAIAADSAVTTGRNRVWKSANKLFSMSPHNDIGIMIYNSGDFVGFPWEIVIKQFRKRVGAKKYDYLEECEAEFSEFLKEDIFKTKLQSDAYILMVVISFIAEFKKRHVFKSRKELEAKLTSYVAHVRIHVPAHTVLPEAINRSNLFDNLISSIRDIAREDLGFVLTKSCLDDFVDLMHDMVCHNFESAYMTGVVFAGFGQKELLPVVSHYVVDGRIDYKTPRGKKNGVFLRCWRKRTDDFNKSDMPALVIPYAQSDIFYLFMEGIIPRSLNYLFLTLKSVLSDKSDAIIKTYVPPGQAVVEKALQETENTAILSEFRRQFDAFRNKEYVQPILRIVQSLPKEEMAAMAEALVELTSLRRKVGSPLESVGGPTDVAFISKGDGFIWLKRKHYFDLELNGDFMVRRRM